MGEWRNSQFKGANEPSKRAAIQGIKGGDDYGGTKGEGVTSRMTRRSKSAAGIKPCMRTDASGKGGEEGAVTESHQRAR